MDTAWLLLGFSAVLALGWTFINGQHRRNLAYKKKLVESVAHFPDFTQRKLLRLMAPTRFKDRWNHATVIAGCVFIIGTPVALAAVLVGALGWLQAPALLAAGSLAGAYIGEALFNSWGCGLVLPEQSSPPRAKSADAQEG